MSQSSVASNEYYMVKEVVSATAGFGWPVVFLMRIRIEEGSMRRNLAMKPSSFNDNNDNGPDKGKEPGAFFRVLLLLAGTITLTCFFLGEPRNPWPALSVLGMVYIAIGMYLGLNSEKVIKLTGSRRAYRINGTILC